MKFNGRGRSPRKADKESGPERVGLFYLLLSSIPEIPLVILDPIFLEDEDQFLFERLFLMVIFLGGDIFFEALVDQISQKRMRRSHPANGSTETVVLLILSRVKNRPSLLSVSCLEQDSSTERSAGERDRGRPRHRVVEIDCF